MISAQFCNFEASIKSIQKYFKASKCKLSQSRTMQLIFHDHRSTNGFNNFVSSDQLENGTIYLKFFGYIALKGNDQYSLEDTFFRSMKKKIGKSENERIQSFQQRNDIFQPCSEILSRLKRSVISIEVCAFPFFNDIRSIL